MGATTPSLQPLISDATALGNSEPFAVMFGLGVNVSAYFIEVTLAPRGPVQYFAGVRFLGIRLIAARRSCLCRADLHLWSSDLATDVS